MVSLNERKSLVRLLTIKDSNIFNIFIGCLKNIRVACLLNIGMCMAEMQTEQFPAGKGSFEGLSIFQDGSMACSCCLFFSI